MLPVDALVLHRIKGIGNKAQIALIKCFIEHRLDSLESILELDPRKTSHLSRPLNLLSAFFANGTYSSVKKECEQDLAEWSTFGITTVTFGSGKYPIQLTQLDDPPALLFCKGNTDLLSTPKSIAVVGTRKNTQLGELIAQKTVEHFANRGFCVVSGLAHGIDAIAHRAALKFNAHTIAVLVDVNNVSPPGNRDLAQKIIDQNGLLISENPPGIKSVPGLFVKRDRIQAGLGLAVFAIETSVDGGTMHAVKTASLLDRPIYVPDPKAAGYPDLTISAIGGTQALIKDGLATPYTRDSYEQIYHVLERSAAVSETINEGTGRLI